jgi:hypothetical protein
VKIVNGIFHDMAGGHGVYRTSMPYEFPSGRMVSR